MNYMNTTIDYVGSVNYWMTELVSNSCKKISRRTCTRSLRNESSNLYISNLYYSIN